MPSGLTYDPSGGDRVSSSPLPRLVKVPSPCGYLVRAVAEGRPSARAARNAAYARPVPESNADETTAPIPSSDRASLASLIVRSSPSKDGLRTSAAHPYARSPFRKADRTVRAISSKSFPHSVARSARLSSRAYGRLVSLYSSSSART